MAELLFIDVKDALSYDNVKNLGVADRQELIRTTYCEAAEERRNALMTASTEVELWDTDNHSSTLSDDYRDNLLSEYREYSSVCEAMSFDKVNNDNDITLENAYSKSYTQWDELSFNTRRSTPLGNPIAASVDWDDTLRVIDGNTVDGDINVGVSKSIDAVTADGAMAGSELGAVSDVTNSSDALDGVTDYSELVDGISSGKIVSMEDLVSNSKDIEVDVDVPSISINNVVNEECTGIYDVLSNSVLSTLEQLLRSNKLDSRTLGVTIAQTIESTVTASLNFETAKIAAYTKKFDSELQIAMLPYTAAKIKAEVMVELERANLYRLQSEHEAYKIAKTREDLATSKLDRLLSMYKIRMDKAELDSSMKTATLAREKAASDINFTKWGVTQLESKINEEELTGKMSRRVLFSEVQLKNKQASLYDGQRKGFLQKHREEILKIGRDVWTAQLDAAGIENMLVEGLKGAEFSSRLESAFIDASL